MGCDIVKHAKELRMHPILLSRVGFSGTLLGTVVARCSWRESKRIRKVGIPIMTKVQKIYKEKNKRRKEKKIFKRNCS
jgi:hypothetical protein